jgi:hypothetical protein
LSQRVVCSLALLALLFVPAGVAARANVAATGQITGSQTSYVLTVTNTGSEPIHCLRFFAPNGVQITSANGPAGSQTQASGNSFGSIGVQPPLIAPGSSAKWTFTTAQPYPVNAGGDLHVSFDCVNDVSSRATGPEEAPCQCERLDASIIAKSIGIFGAGEINHFHLEFTVAWTMTCSQGAGGCTGSFHLSAPFVLLKHGSTLFVTVHCSAHCGATKTGTRKYKLISDATFDAKHRKGKTLVVALSGSCNGKFIKTYAFVFDKFGQVDKKKSNLKGTLRSVNQLRR